MAVGSSEKNYFNFVGGLNTEGSALNNPENTADVLENFIIELNGTLRKRPGLTISGALVTDGFGLSDVPLVSVHEWVTAVKGSRAEFFVVQVGGILTVVSIDGQVVTRIGTVALSTYKRADVATAGNLRISAVSGKGNLFVASEEVYPFYIKYDGDTNTLSHFPISISIRDFYGVEDGLGIPERPSTLSEEHRYNLYNQGWTEEKIQRFKEKINTYPSNADIWTYGKFNNAEDKQTEFQPQLLTQENFGNSPAPKGHFILNVVNGAIVSSDPPQLVYVRQEPDIVAVAVYQNTTAGSIYKWQRGSRLAGVQVGDVLVSQTDLGYTATVTSVGTDANGVWAIAETSYFVNIPGVALNRGEDLAIYRPVANVSVGTSSVFSAETIPAVTSFYAGRAFYAGASSTFWNNAIFYSQLIDQEKKVGYCYQEADPTSEHISDLIATDGGVLFIDGAVNIWSMVPYESSLVIFAYNGVWELSGVNDDGFKATSFKLKRISDFGAISASSVVSTGSGFVFWSASGIYALTREEISGSLQAASISATTVQTFYDSITGAQKERAKGFFDEINKVIYWMYNDDPDAANPNVSNKVLLLDTRISAFYTLTFPWEYTPEYGGLVDAIKASNNNIVSVTDNQVVVGADTVVVGSDFVVVSETSVSGSTYTGVPVGFLVGKPDGVYLHTLVSPTYYDFGALSYEAKVQTRYELDGDALRKKHIQYVQTHFLKEVTEEPPVPPALLEAAWSNAQYINDWDDNWGVAVDKHFQFVDFGDGTVVFSTVGLWSTSRQGETGTSGNTLAGIMRSTDNGLTWGDTIFPHSITSSDVGHYTADLLRLPETDTLFLVTAGYTSWGDVSLYTSTDRGATWGPRVQVFAAASGVNTNHATATIDSSGKIHVALAYDDSSGTYLSAAYGSISSPYTSMTAPVKLNPPAVPVAAQYQEMPFIQMGAGGVLHYVYGQRNRNVADGTPPGNYASCQYTRSTDGGATWSVPITIVPEDYRTSYWKLAVSPSGNKLMAYQHTNLGAVGVSDTTRRYYAFSIDGGSTWSAAARLPSPDVPDNCNVGARWVDESTVEVLYKRRNPTPDYVAVSYIRSSDLGATWSAPTNTPTFLEQGFGEGVTRQEFGDMAVFNAAAPVDTLSGAQYPAHLFITTDRDALSNSSGPSRILYNRYSPETLNTPPFDINNGFVRLTISPMGGFGEFNNRGVGLAFDPTGLGVWGTKNYISMRHTDGVSLFADHGTLYIGPSTQQYYHETYNKAADFNHFSLSLNTWFDRPEVRIISPTKIQSVVEVYTGVFLTYTYEIPAGKKYIKVTTAVTAGAVNLTEVWYGRVIGGQPDWASDAVSTATGTTVSEDFVIVSGSTSGMSHGIYVPPGEAVPATVSRVNGYTLSPWSLAQTIATTNYPALQIAAWGGAAIPAGVTQMLTYYIVFGTSAADVQANIPV